MSTWFKVWLAHFRCDFYLLVGAWRSEQHFTESDEKGVIRIAAVKTVLSPGSPGGVQIKAIRIFYER